MKGKSAISAWQLAVLLFISRTMQFFLTASSQNGRIETLSLVMILPLSLAATAIVLLPAYFLQHRCEGRGLFDVAFAQWGKGGMALAIFFLLFALGVLIQTVSAFSYFLTSEVYPDTSPWLFILLLMAVGAYAASMGYEPTARYGSFVFIAFLIALVFAGISLLPQAEWEYLRPPVYNTMKEQWKLFLNLTLGNAEIIALLFLFPAVNKSKQSVFWKWSALSLVILEIIFVVSTAVLGDYAQSQRFPFYTVTKIAQVSIFERLDSLHVAIWVFMVLVRLALFLEVAGKSLARLLPKKAGKYSVCICAAAVAFIAGSLIDEPGVLQKMGQFLSAGIPVIVLAFLVPLILLIFERRGQKTK